MSQSTWARRWRRYAYLTALLIGLLVLVAYSVAPGSSRAAETAAKDGGLFDLLDTDGKERHHMPAASSQNEVPGYTSGCGPAIRMDPSDHQKTASWGKGEKADGKGGLVDADTYRQRQTDLIKAGKFRAAMQMDIDNIQALFGSKYDEAIYQMLEAYEKIKDSLTSLDPSSCEPQPPPSGGGGNEDPPPQPALSLTARQSQLHAFMEWDYPEQQMSGEAGTPPGPVEAVFDFTATRHPDVDVVVEVAWGDGSTTNVTVPAGTGTFGTALRHAYAAPAEQGGKGSYRAEARYRYQQAVVPPGWVEAHPVAAQLIGLETC